jgi:hypothetical protein
MAASPREGFMRVHRIVALERGQVVAAPGQRGKNEGVRGLVEAHAKA